MDSEMIIKMYNHSYYLNEICEDLEISMKHLLNVLEERIEEFMYTGAVTFSQTHIRDILIEYVDNQTSSKAIARKYHHCSKTILKILHENKIYLRPKGTKKIFEDDEVVIIKMYEDNIATKDIALYFDVNPGAILDVLHKHSIELRVYKPTIASRESSRKYHCNTNYFSYLNSSDKVYFLGLFASDGSFIKSPDGIKLTGIQISQKKGSSSILQKFLDYVESDDSLREQSYKYTYKGKTRILYSSVAAIYSQKMAEDVRKQLELPAVFYKTFDVTYPSTIPPSMVRHFCRGIFDGDGTINYRKSKHEKDMSLSFYGTKQLLEGIRSAICNNCPVSFPEIKPKITKTSKSDKLFELSWSGRNQMITILDWMYDDTFLYIEEKYNVYRSIDRRKRIVDLSEITSIHTIINRRKEMGITQTKLAHSLICSGAVISDLERNIRTTMTAQLAKKLLDFLSIKYDEEAFYH